MALIEDNLDDFIRLEYSWHSIQSSVDSAVSALRAIFSLMATANNAPPRVINTGISWNLNPMGRSFSVSSHSDSEHGGAASTVRATLLPRLLSHCSGSPSRMARPKRLLLPKAVQARCLFRFLRRIQGVFSRA
jgi:hypothetical protein